MTAQDPYQLTMIRL